MYGKALLSGTAYTGNMSQDLMIPTKQALSSQGEHIRSVTNTPKRKNASYNWGEDSESQSAFFNKMYVDVQIKFGRIK